MFHRLIHRISFDSLLGLVPEQHGIIISAAALRLIPHGQESLKMQYVECSMYITSNTVWPNLMFRL